LLLLLLPSLLVQSPWAYGIETSHLYLSGRFHAAHYRGVWDKHQHPLLFRRISPVGGGLPSDAPLVLKKFLATMLCVKIIVDNREDGKRKAESPLLLRL
jgi:hypothetical protein